MVDLSRPIAPYLPPEIISRIVFLIQKELSHPSRELSVLSLLSRVGLEWRIECQRRLFKSVSITSVKELLLLLAGVQDGIGKVILRFEIHLDLESPPRPSIYFSILEKTPNLQYLSLSIDQSLEDPSSMEGLASAMLGLILHFPHLAEIELHSRSESWIQPIFSPILEAAPNLVSLQMMISSDYDGYLWPSSFLKLKKLDLWGTSILKGIVFDVDSFRGLETLNVSIGRHESWKLTLDWTCLPCFEAIGATLNQLEIEGQVTFDESCYASLLALESLSLFTLSPPEGSDRRFEGKLLPLTNLTRLEHLTIWSRESPHDFSSLPPLKTFNLLGMSVIDVIESMKDLQAGQIPFKKLILGLTYDYSTYEEGEEVCLAEVKEIQVRCEELGINFDSSVGMLRGVNIDLIDYWEFFQNILGSWIGICKKARFVKFEIGTVC